jgi:hypothetical protein
VCLRHPGCLTRLKRAKLFAALLIVTGSQVNIVFESANKSDRQALKGTEVASHALGRWGNVPLSCCKSNNNDMTIPMWRPLCCYLSFALLGIEIAGCLISGLPGPTFWIDRRIVGGRTTLSIYYGECLEGEC